MDEIVQATGQTQMPFVPMTIRELCEQRERFNVWPTFQRNAVWTIHYKQALIDSILSSDPFPPITAWKELNERGETIYRITDGHQRIATILAFYDCLFRTWTSTRKESIEPESNVPKEGGRDFKRMSPYSRNCFLDYVFYIMVTPSDESEQARNIRYLRTQNHMPLTAAEKLKIYTSEAKIIARSIEKHGFWDDLYIGRDKRAQTYQSGLQLIALELAPSVIIDIRPDHIRSLAAGKLDSRITGDGSLMKTIFSRLDTIRYLYDGLQFTSRGLIIVMYQSSIFLEQAGYIIQDKHKGALTGWMEGFIAEYSRNRKGFSHGLYDSPIHNLNHMTFQQRFWAKHYKTVMALLNVDLTDKPLPILDIA
jgi:hypothetical protein